MPNHNGKETPILENYKKNDAPISKDYLQFTFHLP
jgi:hypothetical protein